MSSKDKPTPTAPNAPAGLKKQVSPPKPKLTRAFDSVSPPKPNQDKGKK